MLRYDKLKPVMLGSIRWRIGISYVLLLVISMGVLGVLLVHYVRDERMSDLRAQLEGEAHLVGDQAATLLAAGDGIDQIDSAIVRLGQQIDAGITVVALDGTVLGDSEQDPRTMDNQLTFTRPEIQQALLTGIGESTRHSTILGEKVLYVAVLFRDSSGQPAGIARVDLPTSAVDHSVADVERTVGWILGITTVLAVLVALYIARAHGREIRTVTAAAKQMSRGDIDQRIYVSAGSETAELAAAFNEMAGNLGSLISNLSAETGKLSAVLDTMDSGVVMTDINGGVVMTNPAAGRLFDFDHRKAAGQRLMEVIPDHEVNDIFRAYLRTGQQQSRQIEQPHSGRLLRAIASRVVYHETLGVLLMFQDLTEVQRLQTTRQRFIANISHELRTPLASIKAVAETLREGALRDPKIAANFLGMIENEVDRMTQMVRELTELSRIETGQIELKPEPIDLAAVIDDSVARIAHQAERKEITVREVLQDDLPLVHAEAERIGQVLVNLLHNAVKFTPSGGTITVSATAAGKQVSVSVADTGEGIARDDLPHVFQRFYKADKARSSEGTGLGLAISKHLIQAHGGQIWVESGGLGEGATFSFTLPVSSQQ